MKRFTRYLRSRWIYLPTLAKVFLGASIVLTVVSTVISPVFRWSILDALLITVLVAEVNYLYLRRVFERPAIMFAEKVSRIMLDHDELNHFIDPDGQCTTARLRRRHKETN